LPGGAGHGRGPDGGDGGCRGTYQESQGEGSGCGSGAAMDCSDGAHLDCDGAVTTGNGAVDD